MARLQHTSPVTGNTFVLDDYSVKTDNIPDVNAVVDVVDGIIRVDVNGNGSLDINPVPTLGTVRVTRVPGYLGNIGFHVVLEDWDASATPNAIALAVYSEPNAVGYLYTTGAMLWNSEEEEWGCICPPGFEPGDNVDIHFAILYGATPISTFTLQASQSSYSFATGGDWA